MQCQMLGPNARLICRLFCAGFTAMSAVLWLALICYSGSDFRVIVDFNFYGEGTFELYLCALVSVFGMVGLYVAFTDPVE